MKRIKPLIASNNEAIRGHRCFIYIWQHKKWPHFHWASEAIIDSFSAQIMAEREGYYEVLEKCQKGDLENALSQAEQFGLAKEAAKEMINELIHKLRSWPDHFSECGFKTKEIEQFRPSFMKVMENRERNFSYISS